MGIYSPSRVRECLRRSPLTITQVAAAANLSTSTVKQYASGRRSMSPAAMGRMSTALGVSVASFYDEDVA